MKHQYKLTKDIKNEKFTIQEYSITENEGPILICKEVYSIKKLKSLLDGPHSQITKNLRTHNIYPLGSYMPSITNKVINMLKENIKESTIDLNFDDKDRISLKDNKIEKTSTNEIINIDSLLNENITSSPNKE